MSYADAIYTILSEDDTLLDTLTGGVYLKKNLTPEGIDREETEDAYDDDGLLLPIAIVKARGNIPTFELRDEAEQLTSTEQVVEVWFHNDRDAGWGALETAADRVYALLHDKQIPGGFRATLVNEVTDFRDPEMDNACTQRLDFQVTGRRSV